MPKKLLLILSIIGILISSYLAYAKLSHTSLLCGLSGGCDAVQNSEYSTLLGIPMGIWGMGFYFVLFTVFYIEKMPRLRLIRTSLVAWGLVYTAYLTYLEAFVINAWCRWCVASALNMLLIGIIYFVNLNKLESSMEDSE